jgi:Ca2+-binding RTX toxin-like protein
MKTLKNAWDLYTIGDYSLFNNDWGIPSDYNWSIANTSVAFNSAWYGLRTTVLTWNVPNYTAPNVGVWAYPEVYWGSQYNAINPAVSTTVQNIKSLKVNYYTAISDSVSYDSSSFQGANVLIELWTKNAAGVITNEIGVMVRGWELPGGVQAATYNDSYINATEEVHYNWGDHTYICLRTNSDQLSGTIDFGLILQDLVKKGVVNKNDTISGVELGAEVASGSGSLIVNKFSVYESVSTTHTIKQIGTANNNFFDISTNNPYDIKGYANIGTVSLANEPVASTVNLAKGVISASSANDKSILATSKVSNIANIIGGDYNDKLVGNALTNMIIGGDGNDILDGGAGGKDILTGGLGDDNFILHTKGKYSTVTITDYSKAQDHIGIDTALFNKINKKPSLFDQYFHYDNDSHMLGYDCTGRGKYFSDVACIDLVGQSKFGFTDFIPYVIT